MNIHKYSNSSIMALCTFTIMYRHSGIPQFKILCCWLLLRISYNFKKLTTLQVNKILIWAFNYHKFVFTQQQIRFFPLKVFVIQKQHHLVENGVWDPKTEGLITLYLLTQQGPCWNRTCSFFIIQKSYDDVLRFWRLGMKTEPLCLQFMSMA